MNAKLKLLQILFTYKLQPANCSGVDECWREGLFRCQNDLEGIVAKRKFYPYLPEQAAWYKIRNRSYSQWAGREELFVRARAQWRSGR